MTLELTDKNTGAMETATEENMITETVNDILGLNPMGIFYAATGEYDEALLWNGNLLPICPNMILLFSEALAEDEELLYESTDNLPVAYASNDVNSTSQGEPEPDGPIPYRYRSRDGELVIETSEA